MGEWIARAHTMRSYLPGIPARAGGDSAAAGGYESTAEALSSTCDVRQALSHNLRQRIP